MSKPSFSAMMSMAMKPGIVAGVFILGAGISQPYHQEFRCLTGGGCL